MSGIDPAQARDHIEMVDRILAETQQRLCCGGEFFVVWGIASAFTTIVFHLVGIKVLPLPAMWSAPIVLVAAAVFSAVRGRRTRAALARTPLVQREFFNVLWLTLGLAFIVDAAAYNIFSGIASAAIWSVAEAIVLLYIGMHGNRRAQIAGILVVASIVVANFIGSSMAAYVLAAGMLAGYGGFGAAELLSRD